MNSPFLGSGAGDAGRPKERPPTTHRKATDAHHPPRRLPQRPTSGMLDGPYHQMDKAELADFLALWEDWHRQALALLPHRIYPTAPTVWVAARGWGSRLV